MLLCRATHNIFRHHHQRDDDDDDGGSGGPLLLRFQVSQLSITSWPHYLPPLPPTSHLSSCPADTSPSAGKSSRAGPATLRTAPGTSRPRRSWGRAPGRSFSPPPEQPSFQAERNRRGGPAARMRLVRVKWMEGVKHLPESSWTVREHVASGWYFQNKNSKDSVIPLM